MALGDVLGDGQSQAGAASLPVPGLVGPVEALKNVGQALGVDAIPLVLNGHPGSALRRLQGEGDLPADGSILDAVVHQHPETLLDEAQVGVDRHGSLAPTGRKGVGLVDHPSLLVDLRHHLGEVEVGHLHLHGVIVTTGQKEKLLHQLLHGLRLATDGVNGLLTGGGVVLSPAVQQAGIALDDGDGGAQLVGGVGDEAHLGTVGRPQPVQHGVDGLGQVPELLLSAGDRDALVQMGGIDLVQTSRQGGELGGRHVGGRAAQPGCRRRQILDGAEGLFDGAGIFQQVEEQAEELAHQQDAPGKGQDGHRPLQVQCDGVGLPIVGQGEGVGGAAAGMALPGTEEQGILPQGENPQGLLLLRERLVPQSHGQQKAAQPQAGLRRRILQRRDGVVPR